MSNNSKDDENVKPFPWISDKPKQILYNLARDMGDELEEVLVITKDKGGNYSVYASSVDKDFLCVNSTLISDLAIKSINGQIIDE